jgi:hypothetical protein
VCFDFLYDFFSDTVLILRRIKRDINLHKSSSKTSVILLRFYSNLNILDRFLKGPQIIHLTKIRVVGAMLSHADRQT